MGIEIVMFFFFVVSLLSTRISGSYSAQLVCTVGPGEMAASVKDLSLDPQFPYASLLRQCTPTVQLVRQKQADSWGFGTSQSRQKDKLQVQ